MITDYNLNHLWLLINKHQTILNRVLVVLLSMYLLAYAAELTWRLIPAPQSQAEAPTFMPSEVSQGQSQQVSLQQLKQLNLFGKAGQAPKVQPVVSDAPETNLNLVLTGVVASTTADNGAAIIENRGNQNTYGVGEKVDGTSVIIKQVFADRIIIRNGSRDETLMLDGMDYSKPRTTTRTPIVPVRQNKPLSRDVIEATQALQQQPANFTDYINISPVNDDGQLQGYRVSPGKNPSLFKAAGLQANDIITEINGLDLTDMQQAMEAMGMLREAQSLQLTVNRSEELLTLYLDLPSANEE